MNGISGSSSVSSTSSKRLTGLSGFDTESLVQGLMRAERMPLNSLQQKRMLLEWKQDAYRDVTNSLKGFKSKFFDVVNRSSYLLSDNSIKKMAAKSSDTAHVSISGTGADASLGTQSIKVLQLATADTTVSSDRVSKDIAGALSYNSYAGLSGKKISFSLDGVTKEITLGDYHNNAEMLSGLQTALDTAFGGRDATGDNKIKVAINANQLSFTTQNGATRLIVSDPNDGLSALAQLGITSGATNRLSMNRTLASLSDTLANRIQFSMDGTVQIKINNQTIKANYTDTLQQLFDKINNSSANVKVTYNEITDKVTLESKQTGAGDNLSFSNTLGGGDLLAAFKMTPNTVTTQGVDAKVILNGSATPLVRSTNTFSVGGITYTLNKEHEATEEATTITVEQDVDTVVNNVKSFVEEYNKLIDGMTTKLTEKYDRNYRPLTDEQKESMKDTDVEKWEKKAKTGLLRNDDILQQITYGMRKSFYEKVGDSTLTISDIGLGSTSYLDNGKLTLDENKLRNALKNNPDGVNKLLNGVSNENPDYTRYLTPEQRQERYQNSGIFQRLSDIIEDNVTIYRNKDDKKGILLERAGIEGDFSNTHNDLNDEMDRFDKDIIILQEKLVKKENSYYEKFSKLESYLNKMNQQSSWLTSQLSSMQG